RQAGIVGLSDFVVLCCVRAQMENLENAFKDHSIPYQVIGHTPFFQQEPVKSVIDVLKLAMNPGNDFLNRQLVEKKIGNPMEIPAVTAAVRGHASVGAAITLVMETCFRDRTEADEQVFKRLLQLTLPYDKMSDGKNLFLKFAALGTAVDTYRPNLENVTLMTLHAAKGLEFKCVFIVGCEDGLLPYSPPRRGAPLTRRGDPLCDTADSGEERRLLYVGMTRAQKFLFLSHAGKRLLRGREYCLERSPFLDDIEKGLIELSLQEQKKGKKDQPVQRFLFD
ncbi:MAG: DNA helicase UvrD, partial [bacterium]|nr:DNA helicase UvrD [bacterium]